MNIMVGMVVQQSNNNQKEIIRGTELEQEIQNYKDDFFDDNSSQHRAPLINDSFNSSN